jgi:hypothetical protein
MASKEENLSDIHKFRLTSHSTDHMMVSKYIMCGAPGPVLNSKVSTVRRRWHCDRESHVLSGQLSLIEVCLNEVVVLVKHSRQ